MSIRLDPDQLHAAGYETRYVDVTAPPYYELDAGYGITVTIEPLTFGRWAIGVYHGGALIHDAKAELPSR